MKFAAKIVLVLILLGFVSYEAEGRSQKFRPTEEDDLELDRQLISLNKPPIKSFKNKNGEIIDCIDIYKQPAFDHPLLKNHKLQMRPSSFPKEMRRLREEDDDSRLVTQIDQRKVEGCPYRTVPFKRTSKEDLIRAKTTLALNRSRPILNPTATIAPNSHYALVSTPGNDSSLKIYGASTTISVYNLTAQSSQISEALLWLGNDVQGPYNSIEYGWTVNPGLYGDNQSRAYSLWTADGLQKTGCYNALCPGYVQISQRRMMGDVIYPVTIPGGPGVFAMEFKIFKDPNTSNWWLFENLAAQEDEAVGYWPKELFSSMADSATIVQVGGKVSSPIEGTIPVQMGSGAFVPNDFTRTCYASNIQFVDSNFTFYDPKDANLHVHADVPDIYKADYLGYAKDHPERGYTLLFGGPF